jgi:hypothetical protein
MNLCVIFGHDEIQVNRLPLVLAYYRERLFVTYGEFESETG